MIETAVPVPLVSTSVGEAEIDAVVAVMRSGQLAQGPVVAAFERDVAAIVGVAHAVAMNSGTAANHAALEAFGIGDGDEVIVTPFTFAATATPILMQRAVPRFVDVDPRTFNLDPRAALAAAGTRTRGAVLVDLFGLPLDPAHRGTLREHRIGFVEDACQAIGARRDGAAAGALGDAASFSFYATKNVMTGEGGMLVTNDDALAASARRFRHHGQGATYEYLSLGYNYRMTDVLAAIGRVQVGRLAELTAARRANAAAYDEALGDLPGITIPFVPAGVEHAYHQYSILVDPELTPNGIDRDGVRAALAARRVGSGVYYPKPLHLHPLFAEFGYGPGDFPIAERLAAQILALPVAPGLDAAGRASVVRAIRSAVGAA